jgi:hypothetical protein
MGRTGCAGTPSGMANVLMFDVQEIGGAVRLKDLALLGHSTREISAALRRARFSGCATDGLPVDRRTATSSWAIANYGRLTSSSALSSRGIWDGCDSRIHVAVAPNSPRKTRVLRTPIVHFRAPARVRTGLVRHWVVARSPDPSEPAWRDSVTDALLVASKHLPDDQIVACLDSSLQAGALSRAGLPALKSLLPVRSRPLLRKVDPRAESGLESLARIRLAEFVRTIEIQASVPGLARSGGLGRMDLLLDGWLNVELDGDEWHDPKPDRALDSLLVRRGYRSHRFGFDQVVLDWANTEATVRELLRYPPPRRM